MWNLFLTALNTIASPVLMPKDADVLAIEPTKSNFINPDSYYRSYFNIAQNLQPSNLVEAISSRGFLLKYSSNWQRYTTQNSNPNADVLLVRNFPSPKGEIPVKLTTTAVNFLGVPKELPKTIKKIDISADFFARVLAQSGYKIYERTEVMINEKQGVRLVTETPKKIGSTIVLIEGKDEKMVVSTSFYPVDSSIISRELLEQVVTEIKLIQNSITIR